MHVSVIELPGYRELVAGQEVEMDVAEQAQDSFRHVATAVRPVPPGT